MVERTSSGVPLISQRLEEVQTIGDRLSFGLLVAVSAFIVPWEVNLGIFLLLLSLRVATSLFRPSTPRASLLFRRFVRYFLILTALMAVVNGVLVREGEILGGLAGISIYEGGILFGLTTGLRLLVLATMLGMIFGSTPLTDFADYLGKVGLPSAVVLTLLLSLHFIETLPQRISRIFTAQEARGAPVRSTIFARIRAFSTLLMPLMLSSIVESMERGIALELRGYHSDSAVAVGRAGGSGGVISRRTLLFLLLTIVVVILKVVVWLTQ